MGKALMIQGTASGVGKSTLTAGLCRLLTRRKIKTAPFKAQNLTNRVHILPDGRMIARSSAIAAAACNIAPSTDMNPLLIMPGDGKGARAAVDGEVVSGEHFEKMKGLFLEHAVSAYERLLRASDAVVVEGAGSPVELNLLDRDIVNMAFALRVRVPVILVGEINRGGVFASVYGTLNLLPDERRELVKGVVINKFMGDPAMFTDGVGIMERITGLPVLGVMPYLDVMLEDEDSFFEGTPKTAEYLEKLTLSQDGALNELADCMDAHMDVEALLNIMSGGA